MPLSFCLFQIGNMGREGDAVSGRDCLQAQAIVQGIGSAALGLHAEKSAVRSRIPEDPVAEIVADLIPESAHPGGTAADFIGLAENLPPGIKSLGQSSVQIIFREKISGGKESVIPVQLLANAYRQESLNLKTAV